MSDRVPNGIPRIPAFSLGGGLARLIRDAEEMNGADSSLRRTPAIPEEMNGADSSSLRRTPAVPETSSSASKRKVFSDRTASVAVVTAKHGASSLRCASDHPNKKQKPEEVVFAVPANLFSCANDVCPICWDLCANQVEMRPCNHAICKRCFDAYVPNQCCLCRGNIQSSKNVRHLVPHKCELLKAFRAKVDVLPKFLQRTVKAAPTVAEAKDDGTSSAASAASAASIFGDVVTWVNPDTKDCFTQVTLVSEVVVAAAASLNLVVCVDLSYSMVDALTKMREEQSLAAALMSVLGTTSEVRVIVTGFSDDFFNLSGDTPIILSREMTLSQVQQRLKTTNDMLTPKGGTTVHTGIEGCKEMLCKFAEEPVTVSIITDGATEKIDKAQQSYNKLVSLERVSCIYAGTGDGLTLKDCMAVVGTHTSTFFSNKIVTKCFSDIVEQITGVCGLQRVKCPSAGYVDVATEQATPGVVNGPVILLRHTTAAKPLILESNGEEVSLRQVSCHVTFPAEKILALAAAQLVSGLLSDDEADIMHRYKSVSKALDHLVNHEARTVKRSRSLAVDQLTRQKSILKNALKTPSLNVDMTMQREASGLMRTSSIRPW